MSGRHRPSRGRATAPLAVLSAASILIIAGFVVKTVTADAGGCGSSNGIRLTVATDPAVAPAITEIAQQWMHTDPEVNGNCISVDVLPRHSADIANSLGTYSGGSVDVAATPAPTPSDADLPTVWIPDSTAWLGRVRAINRDAFDSETPSVALSPVVVAMPEAIARALPQSMLQGGLSAQAVASLLAEGKVKLGMTEPRRDTASLVGAMLLRDVVVTSEAKLPELVGTYRKGVQGPLADTAAVFDAFAKGLGAAPMSEQAIIAHNAGNPAVPVAALPLAVSPTLDYPFATLAGRSRELQMAAAKLRAALIAPDAVGPLARRGFRTPAGDAGPGFMVGHGVTTATAHVQPVIDMTKITGTLGVWVAAKTSSRIYALVDATSSMNRTMSAGGHTDVRIDVLRKTATYGLGLFTNESQMALWAFAGRGPRELVTMGKLGADQRADLKAAVDAAEPASTDVCPLFESLVAAYKAMKDGYDASLSNTIVVFTDGKSSVPSGLTMETVRRQLENLTDITKPIRVILLGIGPDADLGQLEELAKITGGAAFRVSDPTQLNAIFLKALLT
ncbi:3',5'-cyclic AMP phosphodiesterase CpdA [Allocatelliglobosispora scoriae]|uniref:3',5'-cyclic AMP phosphodiesterase CpdA n=1 Tax=Allocatelliglobosispora scoriae TaxID=643052 RepID=A0A841BVU9_9ACTN|nr:VWA domain-containing protein [Allocatelliglobosispora scoriae]MBB5870892.1 3',5'-cyclic AMP phosphodiesterase CpdA [Allocatelliglobosispora scoriae]